MAEILSLDDNFELPRWRLAAQIGPLPSEQADINKLGNLPGQLRDVPYGLGNFVLLRLGKHSRAVTLIFESRIRDRQKTLLKGAKILTSSVSVLDTPAHLLELHMGDYGEFCRTSSDKLLEAMPNALSELKTFEAHDDDASQDSEALWDELLSLPEPSREWPAFDFVFQPIGGLNPSDIDPGLC